MENGKSSKPFHSEIATTKASTDDTDESVEIDQHEVNASPQSDSMEREQSTEGNSVENDICDISKMNLGENQSRNEPPEWTISTATPTSAKGIVECPNRSSAESTSTCAINATNTTAITITTTTVRRNSGQSAHQKRSPVPHYQYPTYLPPHIRNMPKTQSLDLDDGCGTLTPSTSGDLPSSKCDSTRPIYPNVPYSPYGTPHASPFGSPRTGRRRPPLRESRRISIEKSGSFLQLNQYKLMDQIGQVRPFWPHICFTADLTYFRALTVWWNWRILKRIQRITLWKFCPSEDLYGKLVWWDAVRRKEPPLWIVSIVKLLCWRNWIIRMLLSWSKC